MSESNTLFKLILALGIVFLFIGLLGSSFPAYAGATSSWDAFTNSLSNGPQFPTFQNPFDRGLEFSFGFSEPQITPGFRGTDWGIATGSDNGCTQESFWLCVTDPNGPDGNATYYTIGVVGNSLVVNTTGWPIAGKVRYATLTLGCRVSSGDAVQMSALLNSWLGDILIGPSGGPGIGYMDSQGEGVYCKTGTTFVTSVLHLNLIPGATNPTDLNANPHPPNLQLEIFGGATGRVQISTITLTAFVADPNSCAGSDFFSRIGCAINQFVQFWTNALLYIVNGISFILASAVAILTYIGGVVSSLFVGLGGSFGFLLALPAAPAIVQKGIAAFIIAITAWIVYLAFKSVRGTSTI